ncbi:MAG: alpha/beta hydrolase [Deltaproteobacteria bacterium]|nr:alpha/beta hydrolase [Deltaproteobacteria bacterium]
MDLKPLLQRLSQAFVLCYLAFLASWVPTCQAETPFFSVQVVGEGASVLLIPGLNSSGRVWEGTVEHFRKTHQLHVVTLAGFGGTPAQPGPFLERAEGELLQYLHENHLEKTVVVGHSLGGVLAYRLAIAASSNLGGIVAVDGVPFLPALWNPAATEETSRAQAEQMKAFLASMSQEQMVQQGRLQLARMTRGEDNLEMLLSMVAEAAPAATAEATYAVLTSDLRPRMSRIQVPTLVLGAGDGAAPGAERDQLASRYEAQIRAIPDHRFVLVENARHFIMLDDPRFFYETLGDFLETLQGADVPGKETS